MDDGGNEYGGVRLGASGRGAIATTNTAVLFRITTLKNNSKKMHASNVVLMYEIPCSFSALGLTGLARENE